MPTVLIIEDNENIREEVSAYFEKNGFQTKLPISFHITDILKEKADAVLLDINLDEEDGFTICKSIRSSSDVPILFVTGRDSITDELLAMSSGGDDYIRKPYSLPVLVAKVKRMLERYRTREEGNELTLGTIHLDIVRSQLQIGDQNIDLPKNEMRILYFLFLNKERAIPKDELIEYLWENKCYVDENILNVNLSRLRKRLADAGYKEFIITVPKIGYRIKNVTECDL